MTQKHIRQNVAIHPFIHPSIHLMRKVANSRTYQPASTDSPLTVHTHIALTHKPCTRTHTHVPNDTHAHSHPACRSGTQHSGCLPLSGSSLAEEGPSKSVGWSGGRASERRHAQRSVMFACFSFQRTQPTSLPTCLPTPHSPAPLLTHTHSENNPRLPTSAASIHPSLSHRHPLASSRLIGLLCLPACTDRSFRHAFGPPRPSGGGATPPCGSWWGGGMPVVVMGKPWVGGRDTHHTVRLCK